MWRDVVYISRCRDLSTRHASSAERACSEDVSTEPTPPWSLVEQADACVSPHVQLRRMGRAAPATHEDRTGRHRTRAQRSHRAHVS